MKSKKSIKTQTVAWVLIAVIILGFVGAGAIYFSTRGEGATQTAVQQATAAAQAGKSGDVASIGVYVRDLSHNNVNTKIAVPFYCQGDDGTFIIDGTTSSTSAESTGKTTIGTEVTCWAFNSTIQTSTPSVTMVDDEVEHIVIDAYTLSTTAETIIYDSTLTNVSSSISNLSIGAGGSDSFLKMRFKNENTDTWLALGGFYWDVIEDTNISNIDMSGGVKLFGFGDAPSISISKSPLPTAVSGRKSAWDYVFVPSENEDGNNLLIIDENDYIETSPITFESSVGCIGATGNGGRAIVKAFVSGYYRETKNTGVAFGHETDESSATRITTADISGDTVYCLGTA